MNSNNTSRTITFTVEELEQILTAVNHELQLNSMKEIRLSPTAVEILLQIRNKITSTDTVPQENVPTTPLIKEYTPNPAQFWWKHLSQAQRVFLLERFTGWEGQTCEQYWYNRSLREDLHKIFPDFPEFTKF